MTSARILNERILRTRVLARTFHEVAPAFATFISIKWRRQRSNGPIDLGSPGLRGLARRLRARACAQLLAKAYGPLLWPSRTIRIPHASVPIPRPS